MEKMKFKVMNANIVLVVKQNGEYMKGLKNVPGYIYLELIDGRRIFITKHPEFSAWRSFDYETGFGLGVFDGQTRESCVLRTIDNLRRFSVHLDRLTESVKRENPHIEFPVNR